MNDLHIWAMGTSETSLTVHLVMPTLQPDDNFIERVTETINERFKISHVTIQIVKKKVDRTHD